MCFADTCGKFGGAGSCQPEHNIRGLGPEERLSGLAGKARFMRTPQGQSAARARILLDRRPQFRDGNARRPGSYDSRSLDGVVDKGGADSSQELVRSMLVPW